MSAGVEHPKCARCGAFAIYDPVQTLIDHVADMETGFAVLQDALEKAAPVNIERAEIFTHIDWFIHQLKGHLRSIHAATYMLTDEVVAERKASSCQQKGGAQ